MSNETTFQISETTLDQIEELCNKFNVSQSEVIMGSVNLFYKISIHELLDDVEYKINQLLEKVLKIDSINNLTETNTIDQLVRIQNKLRLLLEKVA